MNNSTYYIRNLVLVMVLFSTLSAKETGCLRKNKNSIGKPATESRSADYLIKKLEKRDMGSVKALNAKARVFFKSEEESISVNANLFWVRDSLIWLNVKKFGLEAVRMLIRTDSVFVLNRLNKTWSAQDIASLERDYSIPDGFSFMQQFILAGAWLDPAMEFQSDIKDELHRLRGSNSKYSADYRVEEGSFLIQNQTIMQPRDSRFVAISFENYKKTPSAGQFPYIRHIEAFSPESGKITFEIELSDVQINGDKKVRFDIPDSYEKVDY
ncbi:MAG: DUF4292 domain-containing protein [Lewinellaceae bacterium]|nr:DUF4292 domain-containing protein [Saprospiraceae bacterium]MCB9342508.1 DUF4292 domain-containing protein [Lewinellaceae bacterium]